MRSVYSIRFVIAEFANDYCGTHYCAACCWVKAKLHIYLLPLCNSWIDPRSCRFKLRHAASWAPCLACLRKDRCRQLRTCAHTVAASVQKPQGAVAMGHIFTQAVKFGVLAGSPLIGMHRNIADVACEHLPCCSILRVALLLEAPAVRTRRC